MTTVRWFATLTLAAALSAPAPAQAATRRIAVVVGNNVGHGTRPALQFAESDAAKMASVLAELGGVDAGDVFLLRGARVQDIERAVEQARQRIAAWHTVASTRVVLLFFFSGHSDGQALEVGAERLPFGDARRLLAGSGADVRLAIVDSCKSGALLALKGGTPAPGFEIRLSDELSSNGDAVLTSAAADESALESREIRGSFFSHHLVSGLRGAADASGDGRVTLAEAYRYAFAQTVSATSATLPGPQHPVYDYRLSGQGELVLTELFRRSASIELPGGYQRILITEKATAHVVAELATGASLRVAVPPGEYVIRAFDSGRAFIGHVAVQHGDQRVIAQSQLSAAPLARPGAKGDATPPVDGAPVVVASTAAASPGAWRRWWQPLQLTGSFGLQMNPATVYGDALYAARFSLHRRGSGPTISLQAAQRGLFENEYGGWADDYEASTSLHAGYRLAIQRWRVQAFAGAEIGAGVRWQQSVWGGTNWSGLAELAVIPGVSLGILRTVALTAQLALPAQLVKRDGELTLLWPWTAWVGISIVL